MGAARKAQQHHADILHHGEQHFAQHLGLRPGILAHGRRLHDDPQLVEPADAGDERGNRRAERFLQLFLGSGEICGCGEKEPGGPRVGVEPELGDVASDSQSVLVSGFARTEQLFAVEVRREFACARERAALLVRQPGIHGIGFACVGEI